MSYIEAVVLYCLKKIQGERTVFSIYHLLKGKRSSQTIQDAHLFSLTSLFYSYPIIKREQFERLASGLYERNWITESEPERFVLTNEGQRQLDEFFLKHPFPSSLNGWLYGNSVEILWKRVSLLVQVLSHYIRAEQRYYPVQREREIQKWVKIFLSSPPVPLNELSLSLYEEMVSLVEQVSFPDIPDLLTCRLTGGGYIGLTRGQASERSGLGEDEYWYRFLNILHYIMNDVSGNKSKFPILYSLMSDLVPEISLTQSSEETYKLLKRGHGIIQIARIRKLKESTIEDHVVEIALNDSHFPIEQFVPAEDVKNIIQKAKAVNMRKLKPIKDALPQLSYFQIRLTLARYGDQL
ncbi:hypothetical protein D3H55_22345 [Bacillus salacetis]|uniref:Helicase Helix-turn-helix domain-containing protein n=1 Tax=Bacillus salacetis TaxID=2315464 RepID=A0A3A1QRC9_9BACI|nr:helix-turn-helix domain-containing protein [Bacillus salacetis]RIW27998.1 hypothetical protein D3H55_22345 [Bacillus salacetis]